ncbi:hypothetical protein [Aneurinibacillus aneurinilyticus]|uniref:Uncharacterized protein n=1 Tax=Aneurinibacillus aneurinilyticus ATCC 12856 TaxID=649747 RepID=U1WNW9_ANEAE|nr:hypothetical protein [Aneurinibacillus aneurinilyticus]ERI04315.1 hypothetical protein HMPREF0083_06149 [Aneurinibacillus aneurinilyticus ATCC 12856]MED0708303.1 hypothetical protein [Aneurinibacillus aneurinilyticus]MED0722109.1 hypothetical protein [Aneurinibacillus aneurinilyticus]MED0733391.1 hypothetical protein [Aneurinibacillus aneurinilyticus]MED0741355.1 hypothetical protein [Aneurinibacillus aneurinilyticus]
MAAEKNEFFSPKASHVTAVTFTTLEERMVFHHSELVDSLMNLKTKIQEHDYEKYINCLISLRKHGDKLLVITSHAMHKTIIEGRFLQPIKEAFHVSDVRIVSQTSQFNA